MLLGSRVLALWGPMTQMAAMVRAVAAPVVLGLVVMGRVVTGPAVTDRVDPALVATDRVVRAPVVTDQAAQVPAVMVRVVLAQVAQALAEPLEQPRAHFLR
jgi:hypothetical protein